MICRKGRGEIAMRSRLGCWLSISPNTWWRG